MRHAVIAVLTVAVVASASAADVSFKVKPTARVEQGGVRIEFALAAPADVEVAIVDAKGKVVRHLAAGLVGGRKAAPPLKPARLSQSLLWDRTDDSGKPLSGAASDPVSVRVRAGLTSKLGKVIGEPARLTGRVYGLATDEQGNLYVAGGGVYDSAPVFCIKVFDRTGKYLRTILPMPATLTPEQAKEYGDARLLDGHLTPGNFDALSPSIQVGRVGGFVGSTVRDGVLWLTSTRGNLCRIRTDGSPVAWKSGARSIQPAGGPMCWAVAPDGKTLYLAGWWNTRDGAGDGVVRRIDPASGKAEDFITVDVAGKNATWVKEVNGWYHYKNWGRKNGLAALHGLAVDEKGRVYVCDRVNQRLAVYDAAGKLLGATPIEFPDHVALSPAGETVYLTTRRVIDGYKAVNEFRVVKLSKAIDGQVLAELKLAGNNAPVMAVDASAKPAVIWLSNVGARGERLVRIEDRGDKLVETGGLNEKLPPADAIVKLWVDPNGDDVYANNGWNGLSCYNGLTGAGGPIPIKAIDLAIDDAGLLYLYGRAGWNEPIYRCDRQFKPVNFSGTDKPTTGFTTAVKKNEKTGADEPMPVYGRYGTGWSNKGIDIGPGGRIFVRAMYDWNSYFVTVFKPDGTAERHDRIQGGIAGPLDTGSGGVCVGRDGYLYLGAQGWPVALGKARSTMDGCVVKVKPTGGGVAPVQKDKDGKVLDGEGMLFPNSRFEGAVTAYPYLAPRNDRGCVCKEARFDLDDYGRLYVPDVIDFCVRVYDNAGNLIGTLGHYGNSESAGQGSAIPQPAIPFGWPMTCAINRAGRLYVGDVLNQRIVRVDLGGAVEEVVPVR